MKKAKRDFKRVLACADLHCGHLVGLTPPKWIANKEKYRSQRKTQWEWFATEIDKLRPFDLMILAGDAQTGREKKSGGKDCLEEDRNDQTAMAMEVIRFVSPESLLMTFGTPYHTGDEEDWEQTLFNAIAEAKLIPGKMKLGAHETADVNGLIFDVKHKIGSSTIPHGRFTALAKTALWNLHWSARKQRPKGDVFLRGHVHFHCDCGCPGDGWRTMTLPALQGMGSVYGARECEGTVDFGFVHFDVLSKTDWDYRVHLLQPSEFPATVMEV
jgi:hypothetical protein